MKDKKDIFQYLPLTHQRKIFDDLFAKYSQEYEQKLALRYQLKQLYLQQKRFQVALDDDKNLKDIEDWSANYALLFMASLVSLAFFSLASYIFAPVFLYGVVASGIVGAGSIAKFYHTIYFSYDKDDIYKEAIKLIPDEDQAKRSLYIYKKALDIVTKKIRELSYAYDKMCGDYELLVYYKKVIKKREEIEKLPDIQRFNFTKFDDFLTIPVLESKDLMMTQNFEKPKDENIIRIINALRDDSISIEDFKVMVIISKVSLKQLSIAISANDFNVEEEEQAEEYNNEYEKIEESDEKNKEEQKQVLNLRYQHILNLDRKLDSTTYIIAILRGFNSFLETQHNYEKAIKALNRKEELYEEQTIHLKGCSRPKKTQLDAEKNMGFYMKIMIFSALFAILSLIAAIVIVTSNLFLYAPIVAAILSGVGILSFAVTGFSLSQKKQNEAIYNLHDGYNYLDSIKKEIQADSFKAPQYQETIIEAIIAIQEIEDVLQIPQDYRRVFDKKYLRFVSDYKQIQEQLQEYEEGKKQQQECLDCSNYVEQKWQDHLNQDGRLEFLKDHKPLGRTATTDDVVLFVPKVENSRGNITRSKSMSDLVVSR